MKVTAMKIYKSLDFESAQKRIEPNTPGEYQVHLEDYESLNDLVRRSVRTKTKINIPDKDPGEYDDGFGNESISEPPFDIEPIFSDEGAEEMKAPQTEQSEGQGAAISAAPSQEKMQ